MERVLQAQIPANNVGLWWLGQEGYLLKTPSGLTLAVDPYLSNSCGTGPGSCRMIPVPIEPEDLRVDLYLCTHDHRDHLDPETLTRYGAKDSTTFVGPRNVCRHFRELGISAERIVRVDAGEEIALRGVTIRGTFALATDYDSLDGEGFLLTFQNGRKMYISGDTAWSNLLVGVARYRPHLMCVVINGGYGNLDPWEAALLTAAVRPEVVTPCHYGMFPGNTIDPNRFVAALKEIACDVPCRILEVMQPFLV